MELQTIVEALFLGLLEGLTEFIPVESNGKTFEVLIQLGAILAILTVYFGRLLKIARDLPNDPKTRRFVIGVLVAFLPAVVIGVLAHNVIKTVLFESPMLICVMLIIGGLILLWVDRLELKPRYTSVMDYPLSLCLKIGLIQCFAMIPGTSRSGATIVGALLLGTDKRSAAEFSFFLAMPTMAGAFGYDLIKNRHILTLNDASLIAVGFIAAFIAGVFVVRYLLDYVSRHGFGLFAWWRLVVGTLGLIALILMR